jgi:hypothetical protein
LPWKPGFLASFKVWGLQWQKIGGLFQHPVKGRLLDVNSKQGIAYELVLYSPSEVRFKIVQNVPADSILVWAEVDDGFWELEVNGHPQDFNPGPGKLRYFQIPDSSGSPSVRMRYRSPVRTILSFLGK